MFYAKFKYFYICDPKFNVKNSIYSIDTHISTLSLDRNNVFSQLGFDPLWKNPHNTDTEILRDCMNYTVCVLIDHSKSRSQYFKEHMYHADKVKIHFTDINFLQSNFPELYIKYKISLF